MKMHLSLTFGALLLVAATVQSARIEDLQDQLELLTDSFRQTAQGDKHLNDLRERIMTAQEIGVRKEAFDEYKGKLADLLVVDGDPVSDIAVLGDPTRMHAIMKDGAFVRDQLG